ncbi:MAG: hypothetical protein DWQ01_04240 [Planctomycetota bacterium]|nr:MAG: hypothetical protein DWQ01_04240 [Planctomycetota bacterium]
MKSVLCAFIPAVLTSSLCAQEWSPWKVLGPFHHPPGAKQVELPHSPEKELRYLLAGRAGGPDFEADHQGKGKAKIQWRDLAGGMANSVALDVGRINFQDHLTGPPEDPAWINQAAVYLYRQFHSKQETSLTFYLGSDDAVELWWNGKLQLRKSAARALNLKDHSLVLPAVKGVNHLLVKVVNEGGQWSFQMQAWKPVDPVPIQKAIDRGLDFMLREQLLDGSWAPYEVYDSGYTAFVLYTLLKCGLSREHPAVEMALRWLRRQPLPPYTYSAACLVLALSALGDGEKEWLQEALKNLLEIQDRKGLYGYPRHPDHGSLELDLSNTVFAALAFHSAEQVGLKVPFRNWVSLVRGSLLCRVLPPKGKGLTGEKAAVGFSYRIGQGATGSMTTAGVGICLLAQQSLGSAMPKDLRGPVQAAIESGLRWVEENMSWTSNPGSGGHHFYFLYGIERIGSLMQAPIVGGRRWYADGAEYLLSQQKPVGSWDLGTWDQETLLALLFLKRATAASTGEIKAPPKKHYTLAGEEGANIRLRADGDTPMVLWIAGLAPSVIQSMAWPEEEGGGVHLARLEYLAWFENRQGAPELLVSQVRNPDEPWSKDDRLAVQHRFRRPGTWRVIARLHFLPPPDAGASGLRVVESPPLRVQVEQVLEPERLAYGEDAQRNLIQAGIWKASASSFHGDHQAPARIADGRFSTRWHSAVDDRQPWLQLNFRKPVRANRILLSHAYPMLNRQHDPQPAKFQLWINREKIGDFDVDPDPHRKTEVRLEKAKGIRLLKVVVLDSRNRTLGRDAVGFSEIELQRVK